MPLAELLFAPDHGLLEQSWAPRPAGVGVRFEPAHVLHRFIVRNRLDDAEPGPAPAVAVAFPVLGSRQPGVPAVIPAFRGPPAGIPVAAVVYEMPVGAIGHRKGVDPVGGHVHCMGRAFVIQCPRFH